MHAVRDVADRNFFFALPRPQASPHAAADDAMQCRDCVRLAAEFESEHCHAEGLAMILRVDSAKPQQRVASETQLITQRADVLIDQTAVEAIVSRFDRRMSREDALGFAGGQRVCKFLPGRHLFADQLEREERRMAFVHVKH